MITELEKTEYYLISNLVSQWLDENSLLENFRRLREKNEALGNIVETHFGGDLSLLILFVIANSSVVYDVEITQQSVETTKYFRYFNRPVTEADVAKEFKKAQKDFNVYDRWNEYSDEPECSIEVLRMMVPFEKLQYTDGTVGAETLLALPSVNDLQQKPYCVAAHQTSTANTTCMDS
jgi:hypothetical protein